MSTKPRRLVPLLQLLVISIKSQKRLYLLITFSLTSIVFLVFRLFYPSYIIPNSLTNRFTKYDRERENEGLTGKVRFPALEELIDRDRLWPPNLGKLSLRQNNVC